ncbi:signal peptide-containing, partial [Fusarium albosuccineum]
PKNPPINEYHPPVVSSKIPSRNAHQWMLQPPPPAKIMEGKVPVSRAGSSGSKSSGRTLVGEDIQLGRLVQEKLVMEKLKRENSNPTETELIESLFLTRTNRSLSIHRTRSLSFDASDDSLDSGFARRKSRLRPVAAPPGYDSSDDSDSDAPIPFSQSAMTLSPRRTPSTAGHAAQRPKLETIMSTRSTRSSRMASQRSKRQKSTRSKRLSGAASPVGDDTD